MIISDFSVDESLKEMEQKDIEEVGGERAGENVHLLRCRNEATFSRSCLFIKAATAIIWDKCLSFGNLTKLGKEHKLLELLMMATREDMEGNGTSTCLVTVIFEQKRRKKMFEDIMRHTLETGKKIFELSRQCAQMARERRQNWETHNEISGILKISQKKLKYRAFFKLTRETKLTDAHVEQELKKMAMSYYGIADGLKTSEEATKTEFKVTKTIFTFLNKRHSQLEEMLEYWMERHERQIDEAQRRLDDLRNRRSIQWDRTFHILQLYTSYTQIVEEYSREKLEIERRSKLEKRQVDSAVRLQTWWRFMMVRKQLGPFRLKRKGKGKGKKGKK